MTRETIIWLDMFMLFSSPKQNIGLGNHLKAVCGLRSLLV
ncbi:hypothetical protein NC652_025925 [Populus alba x Populus x berolinensis]|uniref:Uncharacterized protein n=1 Tax=Populus alba x Populus x berolinensis TaxID=444605 RepID=A0AAD6MBH4_9ROSI|nr:hypothetical protein NC652_025925 [Populus alba x Populus x berolinensis]KAJ6982453.1 hypothetical protein NC653_025535 [Populus alba x Populus x berolinensis]